MNVNFNIKTQNINSKPLCAGIISNVSDIIDTCSIECDFDYDLRALSLELIDETLYLLQESGRIEQWDVICDRRNNTFDDVVQGITHLDICFVQRNCFNISKISYAVRH